MHVLIIGRIVFWAQLGPKINIWSIYHAYLSPKPKQSMKIKLKDKYKKIKNIWMKNPKIFIISYNKSKKIQYL